MSTLEDFESALSQVLATPEMRWLVLGADYMEASYPAKRVENCI
jgi:hypothetical protein